MAASENLVKAGSSIIVGDSDCNPTAGLGLAGTETINCDFLNFLTATWLSTAKMSFATPWGRLWRVVAGFEFDAAPTAGKTVNFFIGYSNSATAANNNPANLSGASLNPYVGYGAAAADALEASKQLIPIGSLVCTADADVQIGEVGLIAPTAERAMIVMFNDSGQTIADTDGVETSIHIIEVINEGQ